jgi:hypothetical protein
VKEDAETVFNAELAKHAEILEGSAISALR